MLILVFMRSTCIDISGEYDFLLSIATLIVTLQFIDDDDDDDDDRGFYLHLGTNNSEQKRTRVGFFFFFRGDKITRLV